MSACNIFTQGGAAYLLTDGARYTPDGEVAEIASKVVAVPRMRMALGFTGAWYETRPPQWVKMFNRSAEFIAHLPELAESAKHEWSRLNAPDVYDFQVFVASYDRDKGAPALHVYSTNDGGNGQFRPGLHAVRAVAAPATATGPRSSDLLDPATFNINRDAIRLLEAQRAVIWPGGHRMVGGFIELTRVDRFGVKSRVLHRWPDEIGRKIKD